MSGLLRYLELKAKSTTGLGPGVVVFGLVAVIGMTVMAGFLLLAIFIWLAARYDPLTAAILLAIVFFLVTLAGGIGCVIAHRRTIERANKALAERGPVPWLDPRYISIGLQVGRTLGWRRIVSLAAVGILAAGLAREWFGREDAPPEGSDDA